MTTVASSASPSTAPQRFLSPSNAETRMSGAAHKSLVVPAPLLRRPHAAAGPSGGCAPRAERGAPVRPGSAAAALRTASAIAPGVPPGAVVHWAASSSFHGGKTAANAAAPNGSLAMTTIINEQLAAPSPYRRAESHLSDDSIKTLDITQLIVGLSPGMKTKSMRALSLLSTPSTAEEGVPPTELTPSSLPLARSSSTASHCGVQASTERSSAASDASSEFSDADECGKDLALSPPQHKPQHSGTVDAMLLTNLHDEYWTEGPSARVEGLGATRHAHKRERRCSQQRDIVHAVLRTADLKDAPQLEVNGTDATISVIATSIDRRTRDSVLRRAVPVGAANSTSSHEYSTSRQPATGAPADTAPAGVNIRPALKLVVSDPTLSILPTGLQFGGCPVVNTVGGVAVQGDISEINEVEAVLECTASAVKALTTYLPGLTLDMLRETCPSCEFRLSDIDVRSGWTSSENDYTTSCPVCPLTEEGGAPVSRRRFVAHFIVSATGSVPLLVEFLPPAALLKEITLTSAAGRFGHDLRTQHPQLFYNILYWALSFALPCGWLATLAH